jgi:arylsulfatase A-like enzyme
MNKMLIVVPATLLAFSIVLVCSMGTRMAQKPNVLFIYVDDLRPDLNVYGNRLVKSPNMDRLAAGGTVFKNQFVTQPTCGASRFSLLTGRRPRNLVQITNGAIEKEIADQPKTERPETFVDHLRRNGFHTVGIGKISHSADGYVYDYTAPVSNKRELPYSWDELLFNPGKWGTGWNAFFGYADGTNRQMQKGAVKPYEDADVEDDSYPDGLTANLASEKLKELATSKKPFFLGVGFFKPHLPFNAPKKYWDLYDESAISITPSPEIPENVNPASLHGSGEFNQYSLGEEKASLQKSVSDAYARKLKHAYYAAISYTDAQIGKVINQLEALGLDKNTIVVVWGDHGWHLGDYRVWGKHTIFDQALRSVLIVKVPGTKGSRVRQEIVSSVDIYPTLMELCGVAPPGDLDGKSFGALLKDNKKTNWSNVAYSYFNKGISARTDRYRYTRYFRAQQPVEELYDHNTDPNENKNVAAEQPEIVKAMSEIWEKGDTGLFK